MPVGNQAVDGFRVPVRYDGTLHVDCVMSPTQAVDATLGRGTCKFEIKTNCIDSEGTQCDVWFECSGCGELIANDTCMGESEPPNYCSGCGREVEL